MLRLRGGGLVAFCELEPGSVERGFEVSVVVEPRDGVGDGLTARGSSVDGGL